MLPRRAQCFVVVDGDGLFAEVGAGHHEGVDARIGKEQMLQRRVGQKDAEPGNARRDGSGNAASDHGGARGRWAARMVRSSDSSSGVSVADCAGGIEIAHHDGQRLAVAMLALAQAHDGGLVGGVHAQMESADAFDGHDLAGHEAIDGGGDGIGRRNLRSVGATSHTRGPHTAQALGCA